MQQLQLEHVSYSNTSTDKGCSAEHRCAAHTSASGCCSNSLCPPCVSCWHGSCFQAAHSTTFDAYDVKKQRCCEQTRMHEHCNCWQDSADLVTAPEEQATSPDPAMAPASANLMPSIVNWHTLTVLKGHNVHGLQLMGAVRGWQ